jgi:2-dehydro-3-deoxygalactonokinase
VPLAIEGREVKTAHIPAGNGFNHDVVVISGIRTNDDVMRGEETQLIGCIDPGQTVTNELFILPGTHSKHVLVQNNQITGFKTYMTGEFFELLSQKSILKNDVELKSEHEYGNDLAIFKQGVKDAASASLLHAAFKVRTNHLFNSLTKQDNFNYLSGLLIGTELKDLSGSEAGSVNLLCSTHLALYYKVALEELGLKKSLNTFPPEWVDEAAVRGHHKIGRQLKILA